MNLRWTIPCVLVAVSLTTGALAQTAPAPAPNRQPAVAATAAPVAVAPAAISHPSTGVGEAAAPVAQAAKPASGVAKVEQAPPAPPVPPAPPTPPAPPRAPRPTRASTGEAPSPSPDAARHSRGQLVNLRLEFTVTDQIGSAPPVKKTIAMNVADGEFGRIRTNAEVFRKNSPLTVVPLSVDARPEIDGNKIRLSASLEYQLLSDAAVEGLPAGKTSISQSVTSILSDAVPTILSQSADPLTDRKVTLEVKATIIK